MKETYVNCNSCVATGFVKINGQLLPFVSKEIEGHENLNSHSGLGFRVDSEIIANPVEYSPLGIRSKEPSSDRLYVHVIYKKEETTFFDGVLVRANDICVINDTKYLKTDPLVCYYATEDEWCLREDMTDTDCIEIDGKWYAENDNDICYTDDGEWILKDDAFWCEHCETWHNMHSEDYYEVRTDYDTTEYWCRSCKEETAYWCEDCECYYSEDYRDYYSINGNSYYVCSRCRDNNYCYCEECGETVHCDNYNSDADCCDECYNDHYSSQVRNYHASHGRPYRYFKNGAQVEYNRDLKCFGFELEVDDGDSPNSVIDSINELDVSRLIASFEHDGSLSCDGFETISYPMDIKTFIETDWESFLKCYKEQGYRSDEASNSCSLHMHFNKTAFFGFTERSVENSVAKLYIFFRKYWNDLVKASRRRYLGWCDLDEDIKECSPELSVIQKQAEYVAKCKKHNNHHTAINQGNNNTIEVRLGKGTLNPKSFRAWIDLMYHVVNNIKRIPFARAHEGALWLHGISKETKDYLRKRKAFLNIIGELDDALLCVAEDIDE